jgi:Lrp/AsnC family transcriptional regulator, regulator for asnA, asnC and gidA
MAKRTAKVVDARARTPEAPDRAVRTRRLVTSASMPGPASAPLNALDANIITLLQSDGRRTNTDIARQLGVAEGTVRNRITRLLADEVIKFGVWPNPLKIGYQTYAFIEIQVNPPDLEQVAEQLASFPEIAFVGICTGSFDLHVAALFYSNEHMYELITKRLNHVKGVLHTSTSTVLRIVKREFGYPVPGASTVAGERGGGRSNGDARARADAVRIAALDDKDGGAPGQSPRRRVRRPRRLADPERS